MKIISSILICLFSLNSFAQTSISGSVVSKKGEPVPGVNIFIRGTYDGASSDENGHFKFESSASGAQTLMATFIGYKTWSKEINCTRDMNITILLEESVNTLDAVTITAGSFTADDESRASLMKPLDIYTTPSANGDLMAAIRTMPGTQAAADDGRLLVRGGDTYETATYIDGLVAAKPYYSKTPDVATRGRFAPSLFSGVQFNTGGYSAEYGQALSSVLVLNSSGIAENDNTGLSLMSIGGEVNRTKSWANSSLMMSGGYTNLGLYQQIFNSNIDWEKPVESLNGTAVFRHRPRPSGLLKAYVTADYSDLSYNVPSGDAENMLISNRGTTVYSNLSYRDCYSENSCYRAGLSTTFQNNTTKLGNEHVDLREWNIEARFALVHVLNEGIKITWGANETSTIYQQDYQAENSYIYTGKFNDHLLGTFVESEIMFSKNVALRPGLRSEHATVIGKWNVAPRLALALKTGKTAQLSAAWGNYYQTPQADYLKYTTSLGFEKATHYIASYQIGKVSERLFRAEAYYKSYSNLITYSADSNGLPVNFKNDGDGYAGGIDLFWRDQKTIKGFDYWLTYSYIDTKRKYKYYPEKATPGFISDHTFSAVGKYWVNKIHTQVGMSYTLASGRPYNNPNTTAFNDQTTDTYSDLSINFSHVFYLGNQYSVLYCSVNNVLGNDSILSYRTSEIANDQGIYPQYPVKRDLKRMVFIGLFLNF